MIDYWWAPFHDAKRNQPGLAFTRAPWVRLHLGYYCPHQSEAGQFSTQTNLVRPDSTTCEHCAADLARSEQAPQIRLRP